VRSHRPRLSPCTDTPRTAPGRRSALHAPLERLAQRPPRSCWSRTGQPSAQYRCHARRRHGCSAIRTSGDRLLRFWSGDADSASNHCSRGWLAHRRCLCWQRQAKHDRGARRCPIVSFPWDAAALRHERAGCTPMRRQHLLPSERSPLRGRRQRELWTRGSLFMRAEDPRRTDDSAPHGSGVTEDRPYYTASRKPTSSRSSSSRRVYPHISDGDRRCRWVAWVETRRAAARTEGRRPQRTLQIDKAHSRGRFFGRLVGETPVYATRQTRCVSFCHTKKNLLLFTDTHSFVERRGRVPRSLRIRCAPGLE
jgi:hypothetical protein